MKRTKLIAFNFLSLILALSLVSCSSVKKVADTKLGTGYSAHELCSRLFVSGESQQTVIEQAIAPKVYPLKSFWHLDINVHDKTVSVSAPFVKGMNQSTSVYRDGLGCTMAVNKTPDDIRAEPFIPLYTSAQNQQISNWQRTDLNPEDQQALQQLLDAMYSESSDDAGYQRNTYATLVARNGKLLAEQYDDAHNAGMRMLSWSMAKTITALLAGILYDQGLLDPEETVPALTHQKQATQIKHLLQMSSGLDWSETYKGASSVSNMLYLNGDTAAYVAQREQISKPGENFVYSTGDTQLLAQVISDRLGGQLQTVYEFYQRQLFHKLGIYNAVIEHDESGQFIGGARVFLTARDWLKVGQLIAQKGQWQGQQIVSRQWIDYMMQPSPAADHYGAQVWLGNMESDLQNIAKDAVYLRGHIGQFVAIIPSKQIVVVRLGAYGPDINPSEFAAEFMQDLMAIESVLSNDENAEALATDE